MAYVNEELFHEIPLFLNRLQNPPSIAAELSLLQFPLRPLHRPYNDQGELTKVRLSTHSPARMQLEYISHTESQFFDNQSCHSSDRAVLTSQSCDRQDNCSLAVGVIDAHGLTLVPLSSVSRLRPDILSNSAEPVFVPQTGSLTAKQVHYCELEKSLLESLGTAVEWVDADFYCDDSNEVEDLISSSVLMNAGDRQVLDLQLSAEADQYLLSLAGREKSRKRGAISSLAKLDLTKQVELVMRSVVCGDFNKDILVALPPNTRQYTDINEIIRALENVAYLIQGYWVLRSPYTSHRKAVWTTRDLLLVSLRAGKELKASAFASFSGGLPESEIEDLFRPLCFFEPSRNTWRFKFNESHIFNLAHPEAAMRQQLAMDSLLRDIRNDRNKSNGNQEEALETDSRAVLDRLQRGCANIDELRKVVQATRPEKLVTVDSLRKVLICHGINEFRRDVFALTRSGSSTLDALRNIVMNIFSQRESISRNELDIYLEGLQPRETLSEHNIRKVLKEFSVLRHGQWCFQTSDLSLKQEDR